RARQALAHLLDRDALAEAKQHGFGPATDTAYPPSLPIRAKLDPVISKYPFDLRKAETLLNQAGWTKGPDASYRDAQGSLFDFDVRGPVERETDISIITDMWKKG